MTGDLGDFLEAAGLLPCVDGSCRPKPGIAVAAEARPLKRTLKLPSDALAVERRVELPPAFTIRV